MIAFVRGRVAAVGLTSAVLEVPETFAEDITLFRGQSQKMPHGRVFGGQVVRRVGVGGQVDLRGPAERAVPPVEDLGLLLLASICGGSGGGAETAGMGAGAGIDACPAR